MQANACLASKGTGSSGAKWQSLLGVLTDANDTSLPQRMQMSLCVHFATSRAASGATPRHASTRSVPPVDEKRHYIIEGKEATARGTNTTAVVHHTRALFVHTFFAAVPRPPRGA